MLSAQRILALKDKGIDSRIIDLLQDIEALKPEAVEYIMSYVGLIDDKNFISLIPYLQHQAKYNPHAAYLLMRIYCGVFNEDNTISPHMNLEATQRERLTKYYAINAINLGSDDARRFYIFALMTGRKGCIDASKILVENLFKALAASNYQAAQYDYGCYLLGRMPNGKSIPQNEILVRIEVNMEESLANLTKALHGQNIVIISKAFDMICEWFKLNKSSSPYLMQMIISFFESELNHVSNPVLALYLAYINCPEEKRNQLNFIDETSVEKNLPLPMNLDILANSKHSSSLAATLNFLKISMQSNQRLYKEFAFLFYQAIQELGKLQMRNF